MVTQGLNGDLRKIDATQSSQVLSAILMIAPARAQPEPFFRGRNGFRPLR